MREIIRSCRLLVLAAALVLAPSVTFAAGGGGGHAMTMDQILWDLGIKVLNTAILGFFAFKYLSKPLSKFVENRSDKVKEEINAAQSAQREAEERLKAFQEKTAGIDAEIEKLRRQTCSEIDKEQKLLLEEAHKAAEHIRSHVGDTIQQEVAKARAELHREAVRLASEIAEERVRKNINPDDQQRLVSGYLKEMEAAR